MVSKRWWSKKIFSESLPGGQLKSLNNHFQLGDRDLPEYSLLFRIFTKCYSTLLLFLDLMGAFLRNILSICHWKFPEIQTGILGRK